MGGKWCKLLQLFDFQEKVYKKFNLQIRIIINNIIPGAGIQ